MITKNDSLPIIESYFTQMNPGQSCNITGDIIYSVDHDGHNDIEAVLALSLGAEPMPYVSPADRIKQAADKHGIECRDIMNEHYTAAFYKPVNAPFTVNLEGGPLNGEKYKVTDQDCYLGWFELMEPITFKPLISSECDRSVMRESVTMCRYHLILQERRAVYQ